MYQTGTVVDTPKGRGVVVGRFTGKLAGKLIIRLDADKERQDNLKTDEQDFIGFWPDEIHEVGGA